MATPYLRPAQWIRDAGGRCPDQSDLLFLTPQQWSSTPVAERGPGGVNARLHMGGPGNTQAIALGYKRGAQVLAEYVVEHRQDQDLLVYPMLFGYRHCVELFLKRFMPTAAALVDMPLQSHEENLLITRGTHRLDQLWGIFKPRLERMRRGGLCDVPDEELAGIEEYIRQLNEVDPGYCFTFAAGKDGTPNLADFGHVNIMRTAVLLEGFVNFFEGVDEIVREQYQAKCEALREARQQANEENDYGGHEYEEYGHEEYDHE